MTDRKPYSYVVLRYVHDVVTGEFVNVGVVMVAPTEGAFLGRCRRQGGRVAAMFPELDKHAFRDMIDAVNKGIAKMAKWVASDGLLVGQETAASYAHHILPVDDSAFQWSPLGTGLTADPARTLDQLYDRLVQRHERETPHHRRTDDDIWKPIRERLAAAQVDVPLKPVVIAGELDSLELSHAWRNGCLHAYEAISLDLANPENIMEKARRWRGHLSSVEDGAHEELRLTFLLGKPQGVSLQDAYLNAREVLRRAPFSPHIFEEDDADRLVEVITAEVRQHQAAGESALPA